VASRPGTIAQKAQDGGHQPTRVKSRTRYPWQVGDARGGQHKAPTMEA
jgi:hypothetical protein